MTTEIEGFKMCNHEASGWVVADFVTMFRFFMALHRVMKMVVWGDRARSHGVLTSNIANLAEFFIRSTGENFKPCGTCNNGTMERHRYAPRSSGRMTTFIHVRCRWQPESIISPARSRRCWRYKPMKRREK